MSATVTESETKSDLDMSVLESLDFDVVCDWDECENAAKWVVTQSCCGVQTLICDDHVKQLMHVLKDHWTVARCGKCKAVHEPAAKIIMSIEPLDKKS